MTQTVELGVLCRTTSGGTPSRANPLYFGGDIPWVKSGELNDSTVTKIEERITRNGLENSNAEIIPSGTLLIALYGATVGKLGVLGTHAATNQAVCAIFPNKNLDRDFLRFYLLSRRSQLVGQSTGGAQPNISQDIIRKLLVPVPPLSEQQRTAGLLEQTDRLRRTRRYALELSDTFLPAAFLELFGDPNTSKWDRCSLDDITQNFSYGTSTKCNDNLALKPVLRIPNVVAGDIDVSNLKFGELTEREQRNLKLEHGDLLFVRTNGNPDYVGRCAVFTLKAEFYFASYLIRARLDKSVVSPVYLAAYLRMPYGRKSMQPSIRTTAGQYNVSVEGLRDVQLIMPPLALQHHFAEIVAQHECLRTRQREALRQTDHLFQSLLHQAFSENG